MKIRIMAGAVALGLSLCVADGPASAQATAASQEELLFWDTIKGSSNPADFQEYLKQYPNGRFSGLARIRLRTSPAAAAPATATQNAPQATASSGPRPEGLSLPQKGDAWTYRYLDRKYGRKQEQFSVRIEDIVDHTVTEAMTVDGAPRDPRRVDLRQLHFSSQALAAGRTLIEFAPYLATVEGMQSPSKIRFGSGYPIGSASTGDWVVAVTRMPEAVTVPAGQFRTQRVLLKGSRNPPYALDPASFEVSAWYAPEAKRYVRLEHRMWSRNSALLADELVELTQFPGR